MCSFAVPIATAKTDLRPFEIFLHGVMDREVRSMITCEPQVSNSCMVGRILYPCR